MAILKHINVKSNDYSAAVRYLWFQHDEQTGKPLRGEDGHCIRREGVIMDSLNCGVLSFDFDCRMANRKHGKNQQERDIKAHHWIISFDPQDMECGLTIEKAQEIGMDFAKKHFAGHQCLIATHNDGHNGSRNNHVHIVCNSLRINDLAEQPPYSQFERDRKAGYKLHPTREMMEYLKNDLMGICRGQRLHQVELNKPAKKHITDKEYRAALRGQKKDTSFKTDLEKIREAVDAVRQRAESVEEFKRILADEHQIIVTESRGRWSYLPESRKRPVTWRRLGTYYQREFIEAYITRHVRQKHAAAPEKHIPAQSPAVQPRQNMISAGRMIDLNDPKIQASYGLTQWAKIQNLKEMSRRFNYLSENHLLDVDKLADTIKEQKQRYKDEQEELKAVEARLKEINTLRRLLGQYYSTKKVYMDYRRSRMSPAFREQHISEITLYEGVRKLLNEWQKDHGGVKIPSDVQLKKEKAVLIEKKDRLYVELKQMKASVKVLCGVLALPKLCIAAVVVQQKHTDDSG